MINLNALFLVCLLVVLILILAISLPHRLGYFLANRLKKPFWAIAIYNLMIKLSRLYEIPSAVSNSDHRAPLAMPIGALFICISRSTTRPCRTVARRLNSNHCFKLPI